MFFLYYHSNVLKLVKFYSLYILHVFHSTHATITHATDFILRLYNIFLLKKFSFQSISALIQETLFFKQQTIEKRNKTQNVNE